MTPGVSGFTPTYSDTTTATSHEQAIGTPANASQERPATGSAAGNGEARLQRLRKQDDKQRKKLLAQHYGPGHAEAALAQRRALRAAVLEQGEPSSANAHAEYSVTGEKYSKDRLSKSEPGKHFLHRLEELETQIKGDSRLFKTDVQRVCEELTDCAEIFAGKLGMTLQDVSAEVLKEHGLEGKDPASFKLTDDEYSAVCQKVQSLHKEGVGYWETVESAYFSMPF